MLKFIKYVNDRGGVAQIPKVEQPPINYSTVKELFQEVLKHENFITESINHIVGMCLDERDFTTHNWIQWFVMEQIEEEASVRGILDKLNLISENDLYHFERDVAMMRGGPAPAEK